jgi:hypothetical protein
MTPTIPATPEPLTRLEDDPSLQIPSARVAEAHRALAEDLQRHAALPPQLKGTMVLDLDRLESERRLRHAREALAQAERIHRAAREMAATRYAQSRVPEDRRLSQAVVDATLAAQAAVRALAAYRTATATVLGQVPGEVPLLAQLVGGCDLALERLRRDINPPPPPAAEPPRPGCTRLRALKVFFDPAAGMGVRRVVGDTFDVAEEPAEYLRAILAQQLAEPVEA